MNKFKYFKISKTNKIRYLRNNYKNNLFIVFLHGFLGSSKSWKNIRKNINYPSLAIDIPGHGKSSFNDLNSSYYFKDFSNELYLALSELDIFR